MVKAPVVTASFPWTQLALDLFEEVEEAQGYTHVSFGALTCLTQ